MEICSRPKIRKKGRLVKIPLALSLPFGISALAYLSTLGGMGGFVFNMLLTVLVAIFFFPHVFMILMFLFERKTLEQIIKQEHQKDTKMVPVLARIGMYSILTYLGYLPIALAMVAMDFSCSVIDDVLYQKSTRKETLP